MIIISIISVAKNNLVGLEKTFRSIISQDAPLQEIEWIVKDADSNDGTVEFLREIQQQRTLVNFTWDSCPDKGLYDGMNLAMKHIRGKYVIFMNSGDYFHDPGVLSKTLRVIQENSKNPPTFLLGDDLVANIDGRFVFRKSRDIKYLWHSLPCSHQAIFYNTSHIGDVRYNLDYRICGDYQFTLEIYKKSYRGHKQLGYTVPIFVAGGHAIQQRLNLCREAYVIKRDIAGTCFFVRVFSFAAGYTNNILMHYFPSWYNLHRKIFNKFVNPS